MIAFSAVCKLHADMFGIYVLQPSQGPPRRVSPALSGHCTAPLWSPKAHLAFTGTQRENPGQAVIYLCDANTFIPRTITVNSTNNHATIWISDEQIAFSSNEDTHYYLYTMRIDGTNVRTILDFDLFSYDVSWSKDRKYFIVTSRNDNTQLHLFDVTGNHLQQWKHDTRPKYYPMWSPDGRHIAFTSEGEKTAPLYVMRFDGTAIQYIGEVWHDWKSNDRYFG
jgi:Tol biopolymer transport system component